LDDRLDGGIANVSAVIKGGEEDAPVSGHATRLRNPPARLSKVFVQGEKSLRVNGLMKECAMIRDGARVFADGYVEPSSE